MLSSQVRVATRLGCGGVVVGSLRQRYCQFTAEWASKRMFKVSVSIR